MTRLSKASPARKKASRNRRQGRQTKPIRTAGKSALQRNPQDPAFGRGEQTCQHRLDRKHPQNPVSKLKLHGRLRITGPPTKQKLKLQTRIAKTKLSLPRLKPIPVLDCFVAVVEIVNSFRTFAVCARGPLDAIVIRSPVESRADASDPGILLTFSFFLLTVITSADYCFCAAAFCCPRLCRRGPPVPCFALSRRHSSTTSTALGGESKYLDDQLLGCFLSLIHVSSFLVGRLSVSVCPDWFGLRRHSRLGRPGDDALGKPTARTFLHSEPLARASHHARDRRTVHLRLVARHALRQQCYWRSALVDHCLRDSAFPGSRCRIDRLLSGVLRWSASATHAARTTATQLNELGKQ